jgi:hypothetical protein
MGGPQEAAFHKITVLLTLEKTQILQHYDPNRPAVVNVNASDLAIAGTLSQKFKNGKLHSVSFIFRKLSPAELNYDVFNQKMLAIVFSLRKWRTFLQGAEHKTIVYSHHQNLTNFKMAVVLNQS